MAWTKPQFGRGRVDAAGDHLASDDLADEAFFDSLAVINNWRSSHSYPLQVLKMNLLGRARRVDGEAIVAQRLKRLSSINMKLRRNPNMKLSQMQDIGGCRAVVKSADNVESLLKLYQEGSAKNPRGRSELVKTYDYIANPKSDGYRSMHYIYKYRTDSQQHQVYDGLRIEIQIRSRRQHAWATAVETVSTLTGQFLKSNIGDDQWKRFFALMGSAIAIKERKNPVPGTPTNRSELSEELRDLSAQLKIETVLSGYSNAIHSIQASMENAIAYLMVLDSKRQTVNIHGYSKHELLDASAAYLQVEKETSNQPEIQAVLVSVESIAALRSAYPNYYLDTRAFISEVREAVSPRPVRRT